MKTAFLIVLLISKLLGVQTAGGESCVNAAVPGIGSTIIEARGKALYALIELSLSDATCAKAATPILMAFLNDRVDDFRVMAAIALVRLGGQTRIDTAVPVLVEDLRSGHPPRKEEVKHWLRRAGTPEAMAALSEADRPWWRIWD